MAHEDGFDSEFNNQYVMGKDGRTMRMNANQEHVHILQQGVQAWNEWRIEHPEIRPHITSLNHPFHNSFQLKDLRGINLTGVDLAGGNFTDVDFQDSNFQAADLTATDFRHCNLENANLTKIYIGGLFEPTTFEISSGCYFQDVSLENANLREAVLDSLHCYDVNLQKANLTKSRIINSNFVRTDFSECIFDRTIIVKSDFAMAIGLENATHHTASSIGIDTLSRSKGKIPILFLRGCGLGDPDLEYAKLANPGLDPEQVTDITYKIHRLYLGGGIQYYSCFISYNSKDAEFARKLHDDLQNNGVRCWFAPEDLKIGDQIRPRIDQEIRLRDKLLVILSENSIKSEWVGDEVEGALEEESKSNRLVLFPIRLDDTVMSTRDDWSAKIKRRRHIGDFSNWKDKASYQKAFERLLRDLKATGGEVHGE